MESFETHSQQPNTENMETKNESKNLHALIEEAGSLLELHNITKVDEVKISDELTVKTGEVLQFKGFGAPNGESKWRVLEIRKPLDYNPPAGTDGKQHHYPEDYTDIVLVNPEKDWGYTEEDVRVYHPDQLEFLKGNIKVVAEEEAQ